MAVELDNNSYCAMWRAATRRSGRLVAICGFDGTGKTTQVGRLTKVLESRGIVVTSTRQPTDWYRQQSVVSNYLAEGGDIDGRLLTLLSAADRRRNIVDVIDPALERGETVICDRYVFSTLAFNVERGVDARSIASYNVDIPKPDVTVFLDLEPETVQQRIRERDKGKLAFEERDIDRIRQVRENFLTIAGLDRSIHVVDADLPRDQITEIFVDLHDNAHQDGLEPRRLHAT